MIDGPYYRIFHVITSNGTTTFLDEDDRNDFVKDMPRGYYVAADSFVDEAAYRFLVDMKEGDSAETQKEQRSA